MDAKIVFLFLFSALLLGGCIQPWNGGCLSREEVENAFGNEGKCLVIVDGSVYDVTDSSDWGSGSHKMAHDCGQEYSADVIEIGPHGIEAMGPFFAGSLCN